MVQAKYNTLYVFEIKFSKEKIGPRAIREMQEKIQRIKRPKEFSFRPILVHVNGVTDAALEADYFSHILDFSQFLNPLNEVGVGLDP